MKIIGISAFYHDSAIAFIQDGKVMYAAQEERFSRIKGDASFPVLAIKNLFLFLKIKPEEIDAIVFYEKPFLKFERIIETYLYNSPAGYRSFRQAIPSWLKDKIFIKGKISSQFRLNFEIDITEKIFFSEHHLSHAASAFYPSPFQQAAILTLDGVGESATTTLAIGENNNIRILKEIHYPDSLGLLYSAFTYFCGFKVNSGEYKLMGLAPYGSPRYASLIKDKIIDIKEDGSFKLNMEYFDFSTGFTMTNEKFNQVFHSTPRVPESHISQIYMDLACSIQSVTEEVLLKLGRSIAQETGQKNLVMAGGVALNCVANSKLQKLKIFDSIWIQPASGDAGGALGAALAYYHLHKKNERKINTTNDSMSGAFLGPEYTINEVRDALISVGAIFHELCDFDELTQKIAALLNDGNVVGWFQGRMEFGPRALGNRSILGDPRNPEMQSLMNQKIKFRESFRPFAPAILASKVKSYFKHEGSSPYMLFTSDILEKHKISTPHSKILELKQINQLRSTIPAVTHLDFSSRLQTVHEETNHKFFQLISAFEKLTGLPILINTSFNVRGEPLVCSPADSFNCFMNTAIDILVIDNFILFKDEQVAVVVKNEYCSD